MLSGPATIALFENVSMSSVFYVEILKGNITCLTHRGGNTHGRGRQYAQNDMF